MLARTDENLPVLRLLRIALLLYVLAFVALGTLIESREATNWDYPLRVVVYPVAGDPSPRVHDHIGTLTSERFRSIESFLIREAERHALPLDVPLRITLAPERGTTIPELERGASRLDILLWSLQMRWTAMRLAWHSDIPKPDITLFAVFHDSDSNTVLDSSTALRKGLIAIANLYATPRQAGANDVVMTHELLHTIGATDKYSLRTLQPDFPGGYIEPEKQPLHPQRFTEIMAGRRALSDSQAEMPASLRNVRLGAITAHEIGWRSTP
jgi:hypothetical protein